MAGGSSGQIAHVAGDVPELAEAVGDVTLWLGGVELVGKTPADVQGLLVVDGSGGHITQVVGDTAESIEAVGEVALSLRGVELVDKTPTNVQRLLMVGSSGGQITQVVAHLAAVGEVALGFGVLC